MEKPDLDLVTKMIADAIKPVSDAVEPLAKSVKVLADTMAADTKAKADTEAKAKSDAEKAAADKLAADAAAAGTAGTAGAAKGTADAAAPLTPEAVSKLVSDGVAAALKAQADAQQSTAARDAYVTSKLKDVPAVYHAKLGADASKWAAEEQSIREALKADLAKLGAVVKDVVGDKGAGGASGSGSATAEEKITQYRAAGLTDGQADFAANMVLPA